MSSGKRERRSGVQREIVYRGVTFSSREVEALQRFIDERDCATGTQVARAVCRRYGWRQPNGRYAVSASRLFLVRLARRSELRLPRGGRRGNYFERRRSALERSEGAVFGPPAAQASVEGELVVRPIGLEERLAWEATMEQHHYLGHRALVGEALRYLALVGDTVVALMGWGPASLHNGPRDLYLGWNATTKAQRLPFVVNNVRFLVVPWARQPHLASRVLAANLRRLNRDWQLVHGHPVLLAETFVDIARFRGTCYRASNWIEIGQTRGFSRHGTKYFPNGRPKSVFVYPLHRKARELLRQPMQARHGVGGMPEAQLNVEQLPIEGKDGLFEVLEGMIDWRKRRGRRHSLLSIVSVAACATLCGMRTLAAMAQWAAEQAQNTLKRLGCRYGRPPSEPTLRRTLNRIDVVNFDHRIGEWMKRHGMKGNFALALDGKTLRGSGDGENAPVHLLGGVRHEDGLVLVQQAVPDKSNEITGAKQMLSEMDLSGITVTGDAMFAQKGIAEIVKHQGGNYLFTVKDNQPTLRADIEALRLEGFPPSAQHRR